MTRDTLTFAFRLEGKGVERQGGLGHNFLPQNVPKRIILGCLSFPSKSSFVLGQIFLLLPCVSLRGQGGAFD